MKIGHLMIATFAALALLVSVQLPHAPGCQGSAWPEFNGGFRDLSLALHGGPGGALTCEYPDPNGSGDVLQKTTNGLSFWRKSTNTPTFTDGIQHWALTPRGLVTWGGSSIDPPADAFKGAGGGDPTSYRDYCDRLSEADRADAPICALVEQPAPDQP